MLPAVNATTAYTTPPTIVATGIPGNNTLRVPPANVSPPVSSVQISNDARGNNPAIAALSGESAAAIAQQFSSFIANFNGTPTTLSMGAQTTFLAQLMSQDASTPARSVLSEYEKMVQLSQVKYKPSNATMPQAEPASLFGKMLQQEQQIAQPAQRIISEQAANMGPVAQISAPRPQTGPQKTQEPQSDEPAAPEMPEIAEHAGLTPRAIAAYLTTVKRNDTQKDTAETV